jgi:hypothetical protein
LAHGKTAARREWSGQKPEKSRDIEIRKDRQDLRTANRQAQTRDSRITEKSLLHEATFAFNYQSKADAPGSRTGVATTKAMNQSDGSFGNPVPI